MSFDSSSYPYRTVVYISDTIGGQGFHASGVLISPDEVLTASHVVYSSDFGTASDIVVAPAYSSGFAPFGSASADYFHYFQLDDLRDLISTAQSQFDYAVIHLSHSFDVGTMGLQSQFSGGAVNVSGYPGLSGLMDLSRQTVSQDPSYSVLDGRSIGPGSSGGPVWITGADGLPYVVGVVSSGSDVTGAGTFVQITDTVFNQIQSWVRQDDAASGPGNLVAFDTTTNQAFDAVGQSYSGPVQGVQDQYIDVTGDSINIAASGNGWFIHSGGGNDAIAVHGGVNVVDGGTGSNFLTGGSGTDTFYVDDRAAAADIWTTVVGLHAGDDATVWGITPGNFNLAWVDDDGAAGYTGVTLHASEAGRPTASLTLAGYSLADLTNGRLSTSFGSIDSNTPYLYVHANA
ncbi:MAG TPA: trypsin-like serine protease [Acetobacteraceae bacterium]|nr:trypsin-like serine protease [Acetobacteraceae bacterium]